MKHWQDYQLILNLSRFGTMRGAAESLNISHATISRRLAQLHRELGQAVFERTVDGYQTTVFGESLVAVAEKIEQLDLSTRTEQLSTDQSISGNLKLSIPPTIGQFLLMEPLRQFMQEYPQIELIVDHSFALVDLDRAEADVVVRGDNAPAEHLVGKRLCDYALCFYANRDYLQNTPVDELRWIAKSQDQTYPEWALGSGYETVPVGVRIDDICSRHHAAVTGLGLTRGACYMADPEPSLIRLANCQPAPFQSLWVLTHPHLRQTPRVQLLMNFLSEQILKHRDLLEGKCA